MSYEAEDSVDDGEDLYRSIRHQDMMAVEGNWKISSQGFTDSNLETSVDLASIRDNNPVKSQMAPVDGESQWVVCLKASDCRSASKQYPMLVDIVYRPLPDNDAHSEIVIDPAKDVLHRKLRRYLAKKAVVVL